MSRYRDFPPRLDKGPSPHGQNGYYEAEVGRLYSTRYCSRTRIDSRTCLLLSIGRAMESRTAAEQTLSTLEERLQRLQFLLHGDLDTTDANFPVDAHSSVTARLQRLDRSMQSLKDHSSAVSQLLSLRETLFEP